MTSSNIIEIYFSSALFINALLFIPQAVKIFRKKSAKDVSLVTFIGFLLIQLSIVLHGVVQHDYLLCVGYALSMLTCGAIIVLVLVYKRRSEDEISLEEIVAQLPEHIYWKDKNLNFAGCNTNNWRDFNFKSYAEYKKSNDDQCLSKIDADNVRVIDQGIIRTGQATVAEEPFTKSDGSKVLYLSHKVPLKNKHGKIVGIVGVSVDITHAKQAVEDRLKILDDIIAAMPGNVYWMDKNGFYLGCNDNQAKLIGLSSREEIIGKRNVDLRGFLIPEILDPINKEVMTKKEAIQAEEAAILPDGSKATFFSNKRPLLNSQGNVVGMVGVSLDITDRKEKEKLQVETEVQKVLLEEQRENQETINAFVHDVRSPVSGALMILDKCTELPESKRVPLRKALNRIGDMSKNLLSQYNAKSDPDAFEQQQPILVSDILLDILTEKRFEYEKLPIKFEHSFKDYFAFINIGPNAFKRTISNLINNAVDAFEGKEGVVTFKLEALKEKVKITIQDNGKGMPPEVIDKLMSNLEVTHGKEAGHGIGFKQVRKTLSENQGELKIDSKVGTGTKIILSFPKITAPDWSANGIVFGAQDIVVILDDEDAIRDAWKIHLEPILNAVPGTEMHFFKMGAEALDFINALAPDKKARVFLLTDFELLNQGLNGLDVVAQSHVARSLLVTSHSANAEIQKRAISLGTKILAKALAAEEIPITIDKQFQYSIKNNEATEASMLKKVDIIIVDDDQEFANNLKNFAFTDKSVDCFYNPQEFLKELPKYAKDTRLCIDNNFVGGGGLSGIDVAKQAYDMGYTKLYLLSGDDFKKDELPPYLTAILKTDLASIEKI